jgi:hypothetical protein
VSELTVLDPIEKLFANARGQICDRFRVNKLKRKLRIIGDITSLTEEQFVGSFGSDCARIVGNRLRKNGMDFRPVEDSVLYREGVGDADFRIRLYSIGVGSLAKLAKLSLSEFLCYLNRLRESRRIEYGGGVSVPQFGALNIARLERVMFERGFRFRDGSLNSSDLTMLGNNRDGSPTGKNMVNAHDVFSGQPVFSGARRKSLLIARRKRLLDELAGIEVELASLG